MPTFNIGRYTTRHFSIWPQPHAHSTSSYCFIVDGLLGLCFFYVSYGWNSFFIVVLDKSRRNAHWSESPRHKTFHKKRIRWIFLVKSPCRRGYSLYGRRYSAPMSDSNFLKFTYQASFASSRLLYKQACKFNRYEVKTMNHSLTQGSPIQIVARLIWALPI